MPGWIRLSTAIYRGLVTAGLVREWLYNPPLPDTTGHRGIGVKSGVNVTPEIQVRR